MPTDRKLKVFLCHAKEDKPTVRDLYRQLTSEGWLDVWLDEIKLLPGQEWDMQIEEAVENADAVIVFLSNNSVTKKGYVQKELNSVLDVAEYNPEGAIFIIPVLIEPCEIPRRLRRYQYQEYFIDTSRAYSRLISSLEIRASSIGINIDKVKEVTQRQEQERIKKEQEELIRKEAEKRIRREEEDTLRKRAEEDVRKSLKAEAERVAREKSERARKDNKERERISTPQESLNLPTAPVKQAKSENFFISWQKRMLLGAIFGAIFGVIFLISIENSDDSLSLIFGAIFYGLICAGVGGLAGVIAYPNKRLLNLIGVSLLVAGILAKITTSNIGYLGLFIMIGFLLCIISVIISRILYWLTVILSWLQN